MRRKLAFIVLLILIPGLNLNAQPQAVNLAGIERESVQDFLTSFLSLSTKERSFFKDISIYKRQDPDDSLSGITYDDGSRAIYVNASLFSGSSSGRLGTILHEVLHQYTYKFKGADDEFLMEGFALLGEFLYLKREFGKETAHRSFRAIVEAALRRSTPDLTRFQRTPQDYGLSFLFFLFLHENFYESDFTSAYLRTKGRGLDKLPAILLGAQSSGLTPRNWKSTPFLISTFFSSLKARRNMLAVNYNDNFTQVIAPIP